MILEVEAVSAPSKAKANRATSKGVWRCGVCDNFQRGGNLACIMNKREYFEYYRSRRIHEFEFIGAGLCMSLNPYITHCIIVFTMNTTVFTIT